MFNFVHYNISTTTISENRRSARVIDLKYFKYLTRRIPIQSGQRAQVRIHTAETIIVAFSRPISANSDEDFDKNWITTLLRCAHVRNDTNTPVVRLADGAARQIPRTHEQALKDYYPRGGGRAGLVIITVLKTRALGAILIICRDFIIYYVLFFFFLGYIIVCGFPLDRT